MNAKLRITLFGDPNTKRQERIETAVRAVALLEGDVAYHRAMNDFYTARVMSLDPHAHWWAFADAKQKQVDHQVQLVRYQAKVEEAQAKLEALQA
jgi:hypothetical protein